MMIVMILRCDGFVLSLSVVGFGKRDSIFRCYCSINAIGDDVRKKRV